MVSYAELSSHVRTCKWIWSEKPECESSRSDVMAVQLRQLERRTVETPPPTWTTEMLPPDRQPARDGRGLRAGGGSDRPPEGDGADADGSDPGPTDRDE